MLHLCRHLQTRISSDAQPGSPLTASDAALKDEVAAVQTVLLALMVMHPQQAVPGVVSAISTATAGTSAAARVLLESVVLPLVHSQSLQHLNGALKPDGLSTLLKAGSWQLTGLQQSLQVAIKAAYQGRLLLSGHINSP